MEDKATRIFLIRHALTPWNVARRIQGQRDIPLCAQGVRMAQNWARSPLLKDVQAVYSSPLSRALDTARIFGHAHGLRVQLAQELKEQDWGRWDGLELNVLHSEYGGELAREAAKGWKFRPPDGESRAETRDRALRGLRRIARETKDGTVLAVAHNGLMRSLLYHLLDMPYLEGQAVHIPKEYAVHTLLVRADEVILERYGEPL